jgi:hypothetical protein
MCCKSNHCLTRLLCERSISLCVLRVRLVCCLLLLCRSCALDVLIHSSALVYRTSIVNGTERDISTIVFSSCETSPPAINRTLDDVPPDHLKDQQSPLTRSISSTFALARPPFLSFSNLVVVVVVVVVAHSLPPSLPHSFIRSSIHTRSIPSQAEIDSCLLRLLCGPNSLDRPLRPTGPSQQLPSPRSFYYTTVPSTRRVQHHDLFNSVITEVNHQNLSLSLAACYNLLAGPSPTTNPLPKL